LFGLEGTQIIHYLSTTSCPGGFDAKQSDARTISVLI
jgi:hypothetical protein